MREQIFNPFVTTKKTGVGLGLSIVSKIVDEHHGTIRLENPVREGGLFRYLLSRRRKRSGRGLQVHDDIEGDHPDCRR